jgi:hypothetical protein
VNKANAKASQSEFEREKALLQEKIEKLTSQIQSYKLSNAGDIDKEMHEQTLRDDEIDYYPPRKASIASAGIPTSSSLARRESMTSTAGDIAGTKLPKSMTSEDIVKERRAYETTIKELNNRIENLSNSNKALRERVTPQSAVSAVAEDLAHDFESVSSVIDREGEAKLASIRQRKASLSLPSSAHMPSSSSSSSSSGRSTNTNTNASDVGSKAAAMMMLVSSEEKKLLEEEIATYKDQLDKTKYVYSLKLKTIRCGFMSLLPY